MGLKQRLRVRPVGMGALALSVVLGAKGTKTQAPWNSWEVVQREQKQLAQEQEKEDAEKEGRFGKRSPGRSEWE